jgi:hypothetical protein
MSTEPSSFLPYHEPGIVTILIQSSFLLILNIVNTLFDKLIFCGLLGQVFIGVAWGRPGADWLGFGVENTVVQLGYLGLILLVYAGKFQRPKPNHSFLINDKRWSRYEFLIPKGKSVPLHCRCRNRSRLPRLSLLHPASPSRRYTCTGLLSRSSALFNKSRDDFHDPQHQWLVSHTSRDCLDDCCNDG